MIDSFYYSGNSSLYELELISLWDSQRIVLAPALIIPAGIWSVPGGCVSLAFNSHLNLQGTNGSAVRSFSAEHH